MTVVDTSTTSTGADLRAVMGHWTTGVTVITATDHGDVPVGIVCNSFTSISLDPPIVSWAVDLGSSAIDAWRRVEGFSVHVLAAEDSDLVPRFARRGADKFAGLATETTLVGSPAITDIDVRLDCTVWARHEAGDHVIILGRVLAHRTVARLEPLTNHDLKRSQTHR